MTGVQATTCKYYNCAYGCLNNKFCEFLKGLNESEFIKVHPEKTIIDDGFYHVFDTVKKHSSDPFPQVDITELIHMYNSVVSVYNECLYIVQNSVNTILEGNDTSVVEFKMKMFSSLPNIVYPVKELLKLIRLMGMNIRKMVDFIDSVNELVNNYDLEPVKIIEDEMIETFNKVQNGGSLLDDVFSKVVNIKHKLKIIENFIQEDFTTSKFINRFDQDDQFVDTPNETKILAPFDLNFNSSLVPVDVTNAIKQDMSQGLQNVFSMTHEKQELVNDSEITVENIQKFISKYKEISNEINEKIKTIDAKRQEILNLSKLEYSKDDFNFSNGDDGNAESILLATLLKKKESENSILEKLRELLELVKQENFTLMYNKFIASYKIIQTNLLEIVSVEKLESDVIVVDKKINELVAQHQQLNSDIATSAREIYFKLAEYIAFIESGKIKKNILTAHKGELYMIKKNMELYEDSISGEKIVNYDKLIEFITSSVGTQIETNIESFLAKSSRESINKNFIKLRKVSKPALRGYETMVDINNKIKSSMTFIEIWRNISRSVVYDKIWELSTSGISINFLTLDESIGELIIAQISKIDLLDQELKRTDIALKSKLLNIPKKDIDKIKLVVRYLKQQIGEFKVSAKIQTGGVDFEDTLSKNTIIENIEKFEYNSEKINTRIITLVSTISILRANYQKYLTHTNDLIFDDLCEMYKITQLINALQKFSEKRITRERLSYDMFLTMSKRATENTHMHSKILVNRMKNFVEFTNALYLLPENNDQLLVLDQRKKSFLDLLTFIYLAE